MTDSSSASRPLRVLVVDADDRVRESLAGLLLIGERCAVVGTAGDTAEALMLVRQSAPDVLVIDPRLLDADAAATFVARVRELSAETRVVVMSRSEGTDEQERVTGVDGFIRKTFRPRELVDAVLAAGGRGSS